MFSIAVTLAVLIPFLGASYKEKKAEERKQKRPKKQYQHHCKKLYERGRYKNKLFMTSSEYPYFEVPEDRRHRRGKSHFVRKSGSFDMSF